jgi:putative hydrolase of HD superfamily
MKNILNFLLKVGKLKNVERKGITFYGVKNSDSATDHTFRMAIMVWLFGFGRKIQMEKALKLALIHDISKVLAGDITPYDGLLPKDKMERDKFVMRWIGDRYFAYRSFGSGFFSWKRGVCFDSGHRRRDF